ncbi:MAG: GDP-mannose 4,6-dehydratase [Chloroflexi bacterium]|nr:GDP-mannose 4,6-dehydratase [Chloroflexota bacterium]MCI0807237.1 GDP-mannose 4,6-dehydratase [Chloroflexota bacterium]MCI0876538.1 GDP-mannose 4,6-dehydratase [Chloroflexota bacterium]
MARYLVTGAAGFIGARVAELLLKQGNEVVGLDNLNDAYDVRLKDWRLGRLRKQPAFQFQTMDILDRAELQSVWESGPFEAVFNLAARAGVRASVKDPWIYAETNVNGMLNLLELCRLQGPRKFVQASTSSLYGKVNEMPFEERADISRPLSPYTATKGASELLCHTYHSLYDLDVTVLRYFTVYGPAGRPDMSIFRFIQWIAEDRPVRVYGDGKQERDFTFVDDIAKGTVAAVYLKGYQIINLGGDQPYSLLDVIHRIEALLEKDATLEFSDPAPADVPATWANITKAGELLGWEPQTGLDDGLSACVRWYLNERDWTKDVNTSDSF